MAVLQPSVQSSMKPHVHIHGEECPWCEQPIPNEKFEEVSKRIAAKERQRQAEAESKSRAEVDAVRKQGLAAVEAVKAELAARESAALEQGKKLAESAYEAKLAEAAETARSAAEREAALNASLEEVKVRQAESELKARAEIEAVRTQGVAAVEAMKAELLEREAVARDQGKKLAESDFETKLAEAAEVMNAAREREAALSAALDQSRLQHAATLEQMAADFASREAVIREEAKASLDAAYQSKICDAETARQAAEQKLAEAEASREAALNARLLEQREVLEKHNQATLNAERAKAFEDKQKLEAALQDVQRQLQKKTAEELGEGAEVDLFEDLKAEFPGDKIWRVAKGIAGADVIHEIYNNGMLCGTIVYDSKNRNAWRSEYVTKLRADQIAAKADHAVLSSHVFPAGAKQLHIQDGVVVVNPARAIVIAAMLRKHVVQTHALRVSNEERTQKTEELYTFITSDRCNQFLDDISTKTEDMEELDVKEKKAHDATWKKRGELIRSVQRSRSQLCDEIERIIGTGK